MKSYMVVFIIVLLTACSTNPPARYAKDHASQDEFGESVYRCLKKTTVSESSTIKNAYGTLGVVKGSVNCDRFNSCMASNGFKKSAHGEFVVKDFDEINCKQ